MKKKKIMIVATILIGLSAFAFSGERKAKPGECKDGMCWVQDLKDGDIILVNKYVINNCHFVDRATVACPSNQ